MNTFYQINMIQAPMVPLGHQMVNGHFPLITL